MIEGEFEVKEEEPWYDHQDLELDLHFAAEMGKNLLEKNKELEEKLQQMQENNQDHLLEIDYLSKQVDLLRSVNDQHAKVYEQLDAAARDLELKNQRLLQENRAAQMKIRGLTETADGLQTQLDELQRDMKKLELVSAEQTRSHAHLDPPQHHHVQRLTRRKNQLQYVSHEPFISSSRCSLNREEPEEPDECRELLQARLRTERAQREAVEREARVLAQQLCRLEPKAALLGVYEGRLAETEAEVQELRLLLHSSKSNVCLPLDDEVCVVSVSGDEHHGISLLNEMDAQYTALKEKYDTLLRRGRDGMLTHNHKAVQTHTHSQGVNTQDEEPAYKALFREIFTFIQKSKKDLKESRTLIPAE